MTLFKTSLLNGLAVAIKLASALVLNKVLAIYVGPAGYAIIGQFQNAVSILVSLAGGLVASGVTKTTAQHFDNEAKQHEVWQTAIRFSLVASVVVGLALLLVGGHLAEWLLHRSDMSDLFVWLALALPAMAANNVLLAIVNGKKEITIYIAANIIGSLISLVLISTLALNFGLFGALLAFTISPAIVLLSTAVLLVKRDWFKSNFLWGKMNARSARELSGFAIMGLTSAVVIPLSYMLIRDIITARLGLSAAGFWQASWKISEMYLMLVTTTLSVYYLPRIAEIRTSVELKKEIIKIYRFAMPIVIIGALTIFLLRDFIINILFTEDFYPMRELFAWQLTGDVIKIGSWVLAYIMIGRAMVRSFVVTEVIFCISFFLLSWLLIDLYGLTGVSMAYAINYTFYWVAMVYLTKQEINNMPLHTAE
jgi:PST family polysaccharide transporter